MDKLKTMTVILMLTVIIHLALWNKDLVYSTACPSYSVSVTGPCEHKPDKALIKIQHILSQGDWLYNLQKINQKLNSDKLIAKQFSLDGRQIKSLQEAIHNLTDVADNTGEKINHEILVSHNVSETQNMDPSYKSVNKSGTLEVCPEKNFGEVINCSNAKPFKDIMTAIFNFVHYPPKYQSVITKVVHAVAKQYPDIHIQVALLDGMLAGNATTLPAKVTTFPNSTNDAVIWDQLISQVRSPYTFIGRELLEFDDDCQLERLVRAITTLNVPLAGGTTKNTEGRWDMACHQFVFRNYTLIYKAGYHHSKYDCVYCSHVTGPFVAKTAFIQSNKIDKSLNNDMVFVDFFLGLSQNLPPLRMIVCPDSMFNVHLDYTPTYSKSMLLPLAHKWEINQVKFSHSNLIIFSCQEIGLKCRQPAGIVLAPCCLQRLADQVKFVMSLCEKHNIVCELDAGTCLGALKLHGVLPWEIDADISFLTANFSALRKLTKIFKANGYTFREYDFNKRRHVVMFKDGWMVELWSYDVLETKILLDNGKPPTKVLYDGMWVNTFRNPARKMRALYSPEIFKHYQHKKVAGKKHLEAFTKCKSPGKQYCLDQYKTDGNFQFQLTQP